MAVVRKKQDDKYLKALRELVTSGPGNRQCFDCGQKGPTYVNMTIGSFVCTRCSGVLRGLTPPHRIKSISMATFTQEEIDFLKAHGNELCAKTWLGLWDPKRVVHQDQRELMIDKYERKRYYLEPASPLKSLTNAASLKSATNSNTSIASTTTTTTTTNLNNNNNNNLNNLNGTSNNSNGLKSSSSSSNQTIDNSFHSIQLTPPQSQRTTANGLHKSSSSVVSRPQHHLQQQHQQHHNHNGYHHDAFGVAAATANGVLSSTLNASIGSSTGALSDTSSCASANGFGGDSDFVADFGSANIFDATSAGSVGSPAVSSASSVASSNGYAKIQPILSAQHHFMNGNAATTTENFADFDHAPIYNAAEIAADPRYRNYQFMRKKIIRKKKKSLTDAPEDDDADFDGFPPPPQPLNTSYAAQSSTKAFTATQGTTNPATDNHNNTTTTARVSNLFVNFFPTPPPLPPPPPPSCTPHERIAKGDDNVFLKCGITRRSSSDLVFSESTSNFNDPFDDFTAMVTRNEPAVQVDRPTTTKFTPLAMAAHATAMAVLGSNYHYNNANNPFERSAAGGTAATTTTTTTTPTTHWPTLWEESADELAASGGECTTPTNEAAAANTNTPTSCENNFGYSLLMNNADYRGQSRAAAGRMPPTFSTYLQQPVQQQPVQQEQEQSSNECEQFANLSNSYRNCCRVAASQPCASSSTSSFCSSVQSNSNSSSHCCHCAPAAATSSATLRNQANVNCYRATRTSTNPFLADFKLYDDNCYYDNCYAHQHAIDDYMQKFNSLTENINYNQCSFLNAFDDCYEHANNTNSTGAAATTLPAAMAGRGGDSGGREVYYDFADANAARNTNNSAVNSTATSASSCSSCATTTNNYSSSYYNSVCNNLSTCNANCCATETATTSCFTTSSSTTINNNLNDQNQNTRTTENCGTTTRTTELRSTAGTTAPSTVDANSNYFDKSFHCCPLPIPNGIHKGMSVGASSSPGTSANNNNNNLSSTPTQDRYAALKDLDEQLRESKAVAAAAASIVATNVVDSFGQQSHQHHHHQQQQQQQQQQYQQQQNGIVVNPFQQNQQAVNAAQQQQLYGQMTVIPNGYLHHQQGFYNFNGIAAGSYNGQATVLGGGPNGCGFGFGAMQQQINTTGIATTGGGGGAMMMATNGAFSNPFAATGSLNSNNPFL